METYAVAILILAICFFCYLCGREHAMCRNIERTAQKLADIDLDEIVATELAKRCMKDPAGRMIITEMLKKMRERAADKEGKECQQEY